MPILRALARDKFPRAGPFLALDETERWTRQHSTNTTSDNPGPVPDVPAVENIELCELQPTAKKRWNEEKLRIQHLSQIQESEEAITEGSPRRNG